MSDKPKEIRTARYYSSDEERAGYKRLIEMMKDCPISDQEILANLSLFLTRGSVSRLLFLHSLYSKVLTTQGIIVDFGVRWGHDMALFATFRHLYEPYNFSRKIIGFDTFEGFPHTAPEDGIQDNVRKGSLNVTSEYEKYLEELLTVHESIAPRSNLKKFEIIKGDVVKTLPDYLSQHPETIIALAYFDLDLYEPTKVCLQAIRPYLAKNSVIGFDELGLEEFPGETHALREAWGTSSYRIVRDPVSSQQSYIVFD